MSTLRASSWPQAEAARAAALAGVAVLVFAGSWAMLNRGFYGSDQLADTPVYHSYGERMVNGEVPYRDFAVEYPPGALPAFVVPALGQDHRTETDYRVRFERLMFLCGGAMLLLMAVALTGLGAGTARTGAAVGFAALSPLMLGSLVETRFDLLPAALTAAALAAAAWNRPRVGAAALAAGTAVKVYPAVVLPLLLAFEWRRRGPAEAVRTAAVFVGTLAAIVLPFAALSPGGLGGMLERQAERPLQIESLGASVLVAAHHLGGLDLDVRSTFGSQNVVGGLPDAVARGQSLLQLVAVGALWFWFARRRRSAEELVAAAAAAVCVFVAFGKVLSPQFLVWLLPLVPLVRGRRGLVACGLLGGALVLTQLWFPYRYWDYALSFAALPSWLVLARNLVLVGLAAALVWPGRSAHGHA